MLTRARPSGGYTAYGLVPCRKKPPPAASMPGAPQAVWGCGRAALRRADVLQCVGRGIDVAGIRGDVTVEDGLVVVRDRVLEVVDRLADLVVGRPAVDVVDLVEVLLDGVNGLLGPLGILRRVQAGLMDRLEAVGDRPGVLEAVQELSAVEPSTSSHPVASPVVRMTAATAVATAVLRRGRRSAVMEGSCLSVVGLTAQAWCDAEGVRRTGRVDTGRPVRGHERGASGRVWMSWRTAARRVTPWAGPRPRPRPVSCGLRQGRLPLPARPGPSRQRPWPPSLRPS